MRSARPAVFFTLSQGIIRGVLFIPSKKSPFSRRASFSDTCVCVLRLPVCKLLCRMKVLFDVSQFVSDVRPRIYFFNFVDAAGSRASARVFPVVTRVRRATKC